MTKLSQLKIDPEFQNQINPPSFEETHQLEMNILKEERVLNPIITWNGYIVDGHDCAETSSMIAQKCTSNQRNKSNLKDSHLIRTTDAHLTFGEYQSASPLLSDLHAEIAAVISAPQRHASLPDQLRMQPGIADVITVAKAAAQLRAAIFCAGVVIGTLHHIHTPDAVTGLQFFWGKARRRAENAPGGLDENAGNKAVKPRYVKQGGKLFMARSRQPLHIAVNGLQCLLFRHDPLQGLVGRNARQYLPLEVVLLFLACICIFSQQRTQAHIESGVQFLCLRGKAQCRSFPEITGKIGFLPLHRPLPFLFVSAVAVGPAGGKGVLPHKICHAARFAHGVVQTAQSRGQVVQP